jgi:hypothetical protein
MGGYCGCDDGVIVHCPDDLWRRRALFNSEFGFRAADIASWGFASAQCTSSFEVRMREAKENISSSSLHGICVSYYKPNGKSPYGNTSHILEVFLYMVSLPIYGKTSNIWGDFPYTGSLPVCWLTSNIWEDLQRMGRLPIYMKSSHTWDTSYIWDVFP